MGWSLQKKVPANCEVLVIGAMNLDVVASAALPAVQDDSSPGSTGFHAGGVGRNIAEGLSRLGVNTTLLSVVGNDDAGHQLLRSCARIGLSTEAIVQLDQHRTSSYVAVNDSDGSLLYAVSDMKIFDQLTDDLLTNLEAQIRAASVCVIDSNIPEALIARITALSSDSALVADTVSTAKCTRLKTALPALSLLKVNRQEAATLTGKVPDEEISTLVRALLALGPEAVLMTLGSRGAILAIGDNIHEVAAPVVAEVHNVNGAGDALLAGVIAATVQGYAAEEALRWGTVAASMSLSTQSACSELMSITSMVST